MTYIPEQLRFFIAERANNCCEYCLVHDSDNLATHQIDHIIAEKHRGATNEENLCYCCVDCNGHKGSDVGSFDEITGDFTLLYHPRQDQWEDHFQLENVTIVPLSAKGRVTVFLLKLNTRKRLYRRQVLIDLGRYPCQPNT